MNTEQFISAHGIDAVGFLTLTFADHVLDAREAQRRFNSLATNVLNVRYEQRWIRVLERQKSGRIHYHLLVAVGKDIRTGLNWEDVSKGLYRSANEALRGEWAYWREVAPKYGFGRTELLPIKSNSEAVSKYVGKYIEKHVTQRNEEDKGVRLVTYGKGTKGLSNVKFGWQSASAENWRRKLCWLCGRLGYTASDYEGKLKQEFGPHWSYNLSGWLMAVRFWEYPTSETAMADWADLSAHSGDDSIPPVLIPGLVDVQLPNRIEEAEKTQADCLNVAFSIRSTRLWGQNGGFSAPSKEDSKLDQSDLGRSKRTTWHDDNRRVTSS